MTAGGGSATSFVESESAGTDAALAWPVSSADFLAAFDPLFFAATANVFGDSVAAEFLPSVTHREPGVARSAVRLLVASLQ